MAVEEIDAADLMPLDTPVLKVSRPVAACSRCRNAKIKCDGKLPACTSCERIGRAVECTSTNDQFARGKERSYVATLETRLDKLQQRLEEARQRKPSVVSLPDDDLPTAVPSRRPSPRVEAPPTLNTSKAQRRKEASAIDDLVSDFGFLSVNATARDFYGFTSAMSYARLILSACSKDPLPQGTTKALPPRHAASALVQHYLNNVFLLFPVFDVATFYASFDNVYHKDPRKAEPTDHWMVRMVLAIANASLSAQRGDEHHLEGIGHVCAAIEHAEEVLHPGAISSVQALALLVQYAMLDPHHFDSWSLIGAASRAMIDLGLHQDPPKGTSMSKGKLELRRRVFHCVYALDRSTSLVQTRAFSFSDDSAKVKVPFTKQPSSVATSPAAHGSENQPRAWLQSYELALDLISLRQLQSVWYTDLFQSGRSKWNEPYSYIWNTCDAMRKWFENLSATISPTMRVFFELDLLYSYVYVLSPSPRVPTVMPFTQTLIFEYCIRYADLMQRLIMDTAHTVPMTFYDAMRVYMTGRQFLDVLQQNTDGLLNGHVPPRPEVRLTTALPPTLPQVAIPPGDSIQRFNIVRSINCIKQITDCLARFGVRWGYMSWNQRYQNETAAMLDDLTHRLRELEIIAGVRRPSMWHHTSSMGSAGSNNGSLYQTNLHDSAQGQALYHQSPQSSLQGPNNSTQGQQLYQQPAPPAQPVQHQPAYGEAGPAPQLSPPKHHNRASVASMYGQPHAYPPAYQQHQPGHHPQAPPQFDQQFNFNDPSSSYQQRAPNPSFSAPSHQFAAWGGYSGNSSMGDTLDDENAVSQQQNQTIQQVEPSQTASAQQFMQPPQQVFFPPEIPRTSVMPPLAGPPRRSSMQEYAQAMLQDTFPPQSGVASRQDFSLVPADLLNQPFLPLQDFGAQQWPLLQPDVTPQTPFPPPAGSVQQPPLAPGRLSVPQVNERLQQPSAPRTKRKSRVSSAQQPKNTRQQLYRPSMRYTVQQPPPAQPQTLQAPPPRQTPQPANPLRIIQNAAIPPAGSRPSRNRGKDAIYHFDDSDTPNMRKPPGLTGSGELEGGFRYKQGFGFVCVVCHQAVPRPSKHKTKEQWCYELQDEGDLMMRAGGGASGQGGPGGGAAAGLNMGIGGGPGGGGVWAGF